VIGRRKWQVRHVAHLDVRTPREKRLSDLALAMVLGRSRPCWAGPRDANAVEAILDATASERLPWEIGDG